MDVNVLSSITKDINDNLLAIKEDMSNMQVRYGKEEMMNYINHALVNCKEIAALIREERTGYGQSKKEQKRVDLTQQEMFVKTSSKCCETLERCCDYLLNTIQKPELSSAEETKISMILDTVSYFIRDLNFAVDDGDVDDE